MTNLLEIIFSIIYLPIIFSIASFISYKATRNKNYALYYISFFFLLTGFDFIFRIFDYVNTFYFFYAISTNTPLILLIFFIKYTFYKRKKSPFGIVLTCFIILTIIELILGIPNRFVVPQDIPILLSQVPLHYIFNTTIILNSFLVKGWFFYATFSTYRRFKWQNISPWIKKRYLIIAFAILSSALSTSLNIFIPPAGGWYQGTMLALVIAFLKIPLIMIFYFGSLFGWVMPKKLKKYFNRNYLLVEDESISEEEIMKLIKK